MYFKDLLRYRQAWLGFALLWIILLHWPLDLGFFNHLTSIGYGGADICFFASGIGCFYSLNSDPDIGKFIKRRLTRLLPTYCIFIIFWLAFKYATGSFSIQMALGNILALQHFSDHTHEFNWYISAVLLFYLFAPYFKIVVDRSTTFLKYLFLVFLFVCSIPFWTVYPHIIMVSRLPIFYIGMLFADMCQKDTKILRKHIVGATAMFVIGLLVLFSFYIKAPQLMWSHGLYWYPFIMITPPLCMAISYVLFHIEKIRILNPIITFLSLCGNYSFELYLVHIGFLSLIPIIIERFNLSHISDFIWIAGVIPLIIGCRALRGLTLCFNRLCSKIGHAKIFTLGK